MCSVPDDNFCFFCFAGTHKSNFEFIIPTQSATQGFQLSLFREDQRTESADGGNQAYLDFYFCFLSSPLLSFFFSPFFLLVGIYQASFHQEKILRKPKGFPNISIILKEVLYRWVQNIVSYSYMMILCFLFGPFSLNLQQLIWVWFERSLSTSHIRHQFETDHYSILVYILYKPLRVVRV